jgi:hypothetical protein
MTLHFGVVLPNIHYIDDHNECCITTAIAVALNVIMENINNLIVGVQ